MVHQKIRKWCDRNNWLDPFEEEGIYYAFRPDSVIPERLPIQIQPFTNTIHTTNNIFIIFVIPLGIVASLWCLGHLFAQCLFFEDFVIQHKLSGSSVIKNAFITYTVAVINQMLNVIQIGHAFWTKARITEIFLMIEDRRNIIILFTVILIVGFLPFFMSEYFRICLNKLIYN